MLAGSPFLDEAGQESKPSRGCRENNFDLHSKHDFYLCYFIYFFRYIYIYIPLHVKYFRKVVSQTQKHGRQAPAAFEDAALRVGLISGY